MHLFLQTPGQQARWRVQTKLKRFLCWIALSCFISTPMAFAQNPVVFSLPDSLTGTAGDTITVDLQIETSGNQIAFLGAALKTDGNLLHFVDFSVGPIAAATNFSLSVIAADSVRMVYFDSGSGPIVESGILVRLRFEVSASVVEGDSAQIILSEVSAGDPFATALTVEIENGRFWVPYSPVSFSGTVFNDLDADGIRDEGEPGIPDWDLHLIAVNSQDTTRVSTDIAGAYLFSEIGHGRYRLIQKLPAGWEQSFPIQPAEYELSLEPGESADSLNFGNWMPASLEGTTWHDLNADGLRDQDEPAQISWPVRLVAATDTVEVMSDGSGKFAFSRLLPGTYRIEQIAPQGWQQSQPEGGAYDVTLEAGQALAAFDFGNWQWAGLSGMVWQDQDSSASKEENERYLIGWPVWIAGQLPGGAMVADTVLTDSLGQYRFDELAPGQYRVSVAVQTVYRPVSPVNGERVIELYSAQIETDLDFGLARNATTGADQRQTGNLPRFFELAQNYPNPFNPTTTIQFSIAKSTRVRMEILDLLGKRVALVLDQFKPAGEYSVEVKAQELASGVYFYKLTAAPDIVLLKKMIVSK